MANDAIAPIIVKKKIINAAGHHGGAWKIAYADFVTAMMAFFLLMWLINATSPDQKTGIANFFTPSNARPSGTGAGGILGGQSILADGLARAAGTPVEIVVALPTTNADSLGGPADGKYSGSNVTDILDQLEEDGVDVMRYPEILADLARQTDAREVLRALEAEGIDVLTYPEILDEIFDSVITPQSTPSDVEGQEPLGDITAESMQGPVDDLVGALTARDFQGLTELEITEIAESAIMTLTEGDLGDLSEPEITDLAEEAIGALLDPDRTALTDTETTELAEQIAAAAVEVAQAQAAAAEQAQFAHAEETIRQSIESIPELEPYRDNLRIEQTPEGLRIQIVDAENQAMFPSGSAALHHQTETIVAVIARVVAELPNDIMITGHTDARPFQSGGGYGNWELSSDRANAARRALIDSGIAEDRIARVVGRADREPLDIDDPFAPINRRISFVVLSTLNGADGEPDTGEPQIEDEIRVPVGGDTAG